MAMNIRQKSWIIYKAKQKSTPVANGCIEYNGLRNKGGYGVIEYTDEITKKRTCVPMHRALFMIHNNIELDRWHFILHSCDNPACINMKHLRLGTPQDNVDDMTDRGRRTKKKIAYHNRVRKISNDTVIAIFNDDMKYVDIAKKYDVSQSYVSDIKSGRIKRNVTNPYRVDEGGKLCWIRGMKIVLPLTDVRCR